MVQNISNNASGECVSLLHGIGYSHIQTGRYSFTPMGQLELNFEVQEEEIWKDIEGLEGQYQISDMGRIKSLYRTVICGKYSQVKKVVPERILKLRITKGYHTIPLHAKRNKALLVHRLVAKAFIPNPENKPEVNHKWGNKLDNRAIALEWNTKSENSLHAFRLKLKKPNYPALGKFGGNNPLAKEVKMFDLNNNFLKTFPSAVDAEMETKISRKCISRCCLNERKTTGGYKWSF